MGLSKEEKLNSVSHGIGALLAIIGTFVLLKANEAKSSYATFAIIVYSITLISMLLVSSAYHGTANVRVKYRLRILDHVNIYFLIAGTYTPVSLITLIEGKGVSIFFVVWGIAFLGTFFKMFFTGRFEFISLLLYLIMGWLIVFDLGSILEQFTDLGIWLLFLGGLFYTFGVLFYAFEKIPYNHFIWHLFVLAGATSHWFTMLYSVV